jgi:hypothetical protein
MQYDMYVALCVSATDTKDPLSSNVFLLMAPTLFVLLQLQEAAAAAAATSSTVTTGDGVTTCQLAELPALIAATIDELKLTPLLLDSSSDDRVSSFLSYTCILADGASLALVGGKGGVRPSEVRASVRS